MPNETQLDNIYPGHNILRCMSFGKRQITVSPYNLMKQNGIRNLKICVKSLMMMQISTIQNKIINTKLKLV